MGCVDELSAAAFEEIKRYILALGGRRTYCNMYNHNPHHRFGWFDAYLNPDVGQRNIDCDPDVSGFDELVVQDFALDEIYVTARVVDGELELDAAEGVARRYFAAMLAEARS